MSIAVLASIDGVAFADAWPQGTRTTYGDTTVQVIGKRHLVHDERAAGRPQDLVDADALETIPAP